MPMTSKATARTNEAPLERCLKIRRSDSQESIPYRTWGPLGGGRMSSIDMGMPNFSTTDPETNRSSLRVWMGLEQGLQRGDVFEGSPV